MKRGVAEGHVPEGLKAPLFASSDRRERINPAVAAGFSLSKKLFRQAEGPATRPVLFCCFLMTTSMLPRSPGTR